MLLSQVIYLPCAVMVHAESYESISRKGTLSTVLPLGKCTFTSHISKGNHSSQKNLYENKSFRPNCSQSNNKL